MKLSEVKTVNGFYEYLNQLTPTNVGLWYLSLSNMPITQFILETAKEENEEQYLEFLNPPKKMMYIVMEMEKLAKKNKKYAIDEQYRRKRLDESKASVTSQTENEVE